MHATPRPDEPQNMSVLIADGSAQIREAARNAVLTAVPTATVHEAPSGPEALALLRGARIDALIIDVALPGMSGIEVVDAARGEGKSPFLILTSAFVLPNWSLLATKLQAYEFMKKPFSGAEIEKMMGNFARMRLPTTILIADAGEHSRLMVRKIIGASRFVTELHETDHGGHALKLTGSHKFDLALVDSNLSGISGLEAACQMQGQNPELNVVMMLPTNDRGLGQSLKHLGLSQSLKKPFFTRDVDILLHTALNLRRPYLMNAMMKAAATAMAS
jgi:CheY-like chemotaxis protein